MIKIRKSISLLTMLTAVILLLAGSGCKKNDMPARKTTYNLKVKDVLGVSGTVTFTETSSSVTTIDIALTGAPSGTHPAILCTNSAVEGGEIVATLNQVDETGKSSTQVSTMTYSQLIVFNGFVKILNSGNDTNVILAQGDIGGNVITSINKTYTLKTVGTYGVSGTALFEKRVNGNTLITITPTNIIPGQVYPVEIRRNSAVEGGEIVLTLMPVNATGISITAVSKLDNSTSITYDQLIAYDGYVDIREKSSSLNIIAQTDIGGNEFTTTKKTYALTTLSTFGVSGTALFEQRVNGNTLVTISLTGTIAGDMYPASINLGSIASVGGGPSVKSLNSVDGTTGKSYTNIRKLDSGISITYANWLVYDGYINIYQTPVTLANIICHGNIGSN